MRGGQARTWAGEHGEEVTLRVPLYMAAVAMAVHGGCRNGSSSRGGGDGE